MPDSERRSLSLSPPQPHTHTDQATTHPRSARPLAPPAGRQVPFTVVPDFERRAGCAGHIPGGVLTAILLGHRGLAALKAKAAAEAAAAAAEAAAGNASAGAPPAAGGKAAG